MNQTLKDDSTLSTIINDYDISAFTCDSGDMFSIAKEALKVHNEANYKDMHSTIESGVYALY